MADIDTAEIRARLHLADAPPWIVGDVRKLCDEVDRLRARPAEVEAERDEALELAEEVIPYAGEYFDEKWALTERLTELKVRAAARGEGDRG